MNMIEGKGTEQTLRFLVNLSAATQQLTEPGEIMAVTARLLAEDLGVDRCAYAEIEAESVFVITGDYSRGVPSIVGRWPVSAFGQECTRLMLANEPYVVVDVDEDVRIGVDDLPAYRATTIQAVICLPLHKEGKFTAAMAVHQTKRREWTNDEIELVELVVGRCWETLERARTLRILRESEQRFRFMAESMPQKIFTANPEGEVDYVNPQWLEFAGLSSEQVHGWGWTQLLHPEDEEENLRRWKHAIATGDDFQFEHRFCRHDGVYRWHLTRARAMREDGGKITMWIGSNTDIDDQKRAEEKLEHTVEERTAALRDTIGQLEAFSYSVSHDMRGPLRAMSSFATLLADEYAEKLDDEGRNYLQRIVNGALRLDRLIKDVLQYSQLARERLTLEPINIERLFAEVIDHYPDLAQRKQHIIIQPPCAGTTVLANPAALTQVVSNLLTNALKFVPPGQLPAVQIICETRDDRIRVIIEDNGIGIAPEYQNRIFGVFERLHTGEYAGTGIGLSIVKKAIERMKGTVGLHSEPGKGSRFWFELLKVEDVG